MLFLELGIVSSRNVDINSFDCNKYTKDDHISSANTLAQRVSDTK